MCGNGIYSTSYWKDIQPKRAFLWESLEPNLRPCSRNKNRISETKISSLPVAKTISIGLEIYQGILTNKNQKKSYGWTQFLKLFLASSILVIFSISGVISQTDESTDR